MVDGEVAFTGVGVADQWLGQAQDEDHWRDTQFRITGPAVRLFEACFYENWVEAGGQDAPELNLDDPPAAGAARSIIIWSNPTGGVSNVKLLYLYSIAGARRSLDIQSPYFIPDASARAAFLDARRRGVRIRILTDVPGAAWGWGRPSNTAAARPWGTAAPATIRPKARPITWIPRRARTRAACRRTRLPTCPSASISRGIRIGVRVCR